jgi:mono/diheme cytochrome c family protein
MRWTRWITVGSSLVAAAGALLAVSCARQTGSAATMTQEDKIARGKYLAIGSSCADCHTPGFFYGAPDTNRWLSGSEIPWQGPWGVTYARNLTPHPETGLGSWTEDQIVTALKTGHRPDGSPLLPPMPWQNISNYSDEDLHCLATYLKSIPPVEHKVPDRLPPGATVPPGTAIIFPPPPAWDAMNLPPPPAATPDTTRS